MLFNVSKKIENIVFFGCGNMGGAILKALLKNNFTAKKIYIISPRAKEKSNDYTGVNLLSNVDEFLPKKATALFLAIKPQMMAELKDEINQLIDAKTIVITIAAGLSSSWYFDNLSNLKTLYRSMPNMAATYGQSMTLLYGDKNSNGYDITNTLHQAIGQNLWLNEESDMDLLTAICGSGPAYVYYFAQCLIDAATSLGVDKLAATNMVNQVIFGAAHMLHHEDKSAENLRLDVTSKNGVTAAGLEVLMDANHMKEVLIKTLEAATNRSKELGK